MSKSDKGIVLETSPWRVEQLRVTVFPAPDFPVNADDLWNEVIPTPLEKKTSNAITQEQTVEGLYLGTRYLLTVSPLRIDWRIVTESQEEIGVFPTIGSLNETLTSFHEIVLRWLENLKISVERLAFGAILLQPTENYRESYERIKAYLPFEIRDTDSDLVFRINKRIYEPDAPSVCRLELDINTVSEFDLSEVSSSLPAVYQELVELGIEIAKEGAIQ